MTSEAPPTEADSLRENAVCMAVQIRNGTDYGMDPTDIADTIMALVDRVNMLERSAPGARAARAVVDEQAEDESLWFQAETITEDILQRALRRLHAAVEGSAPEPEVKHKDFGRWNFERTDDGFRICEGLHDKGCDCEWTYYVPKSSPEPSGEFSPGDRVQILGSRGVYVVERLVTPPPYWVLKDRLGLTTKAQVGLLERASPETKGGAL